MAQRAVRRLYETSAGHSVADLATLLPTSLLEEVIESVVTGNSPVLPGAARKDLAMPEVHAKLP